MVCNDQIHDELRDMGESVCPFCDQLLDVGDREVEPCCSQPLIEDISGIKTCLKCGLVDGNVYEIGFIDAYGNMFKIHRKSVYHRKYHTENVLNILCYENRVELNHIQRNKIFKILNVIDSILPAVNRTRKRIISMKFIIKQILMLLGLPFEFIIVSKSKKTLEYYNKYWVEILSLCFDKIIPIIRR